MVKKQHSKTSRIFSTTKSDSRENSSDNLFNLIKSPLSIFHSQDETNKKKRQSTTRKQLRSSAGSRKKRKMQRKTESIILDNNMTKTSSDNFADFLKKKNEKPNEDSIIELNLIDSNVPIKNKKKMFRRSFMAQNKEDIQAPHEKDIEIARKKYYRGFIASGKENIKSCITTIEDILKEFPSQRNFYSLSCAYYYLSNMEYIEKNYKNAEKYARESLSILDDIILNDNISVKLERQKTILSDRWLDIVELNSYTLFIRKSCIENHIGLIMNARKYSQISIEWFQRSIYSREQQLHTTGLPESYVTISQILIASIKEQFDSIRVLSEMALAIRFEVFFELNNLLSLAKTYAKTGINLCKKSTDDLFKINGLHVLLDVQIIQNQMLAMQEQYLRGKIKHKNRSVTGLVNEKRFLKMESIKHDIERVQRRLNKDKVKPNRAPTRRKSSTNPTNKESAVVLQKQLSI